MAFIRDQDYLIYQQRILITNIKEDLASGIISQPKSDTFGYIAYQLSNEQSGFGRPNLYQNQIIINELSNEQLQSMTLLANEQPPPKKFRQYSYHKSSDQNIENVTERRRHRAFSSKEYSHEPIIHHVPIPKINEHDETEKGKSQNNNRLSQIVSTGQSAQNSAVEPDKKILDKIASKGIELTLRPSQTENVKSNGNPEIASSDSPKQSVVLDQDVKPQDEIEDEEEEEEEEEEIVPVKEKQDTTVEYKISKVDIGVINSKPVLSALTQMMSKKESLNNPLAMLYAGVSGKMDPKAVKIKLTLPFSDDPSKPMFVAVKGDAPVKDVIGYCLLEYYNLKITPPVPTTAWKVEMWALRIVDDGEIDEDFPALDPTRKIQKYALDQLALVPLVPLQPLSIQTESQEGQVESDTSANQAEQAISPSIPSVFLKVHLYSTLEVKQTTIMQMPLNITMQEVFNRICTKRKYDSKDYILKMADTKTDVPLDKTLQALEAIEFCVLKRARGGAGDIFLRPPDEEETKEDEKFVFTSEDYRTMYKQYSLTSKQLMGKQERTLTIDGEYINLDSTEGKTVFNRGKSAVSYNIKDIISCIQTKKNGTNVKLSVQRPNDIKVYDFEASTPLLANEMSARISYVLEMYAKSNQL
ncbi:stress-activated map kinase interacting protein 1-domain-containing protein [Globomyces pollinis-pini]|nr:stress-activated map kinase interacting protein 1-domain-containing protein [Globomyces pollinis-pini]